MDEAATRRRFLGRLSLALSGLAGAIVAVPILSYLLSPLINPEPRIWRDVGRLDDFKIGETREVAIDDPSSLPWAGQTALTALWVRRLGEDVFTAFAVNCPCHGGVYYADGRVAGGPPPKPLPRYAVRVQNGVVQVQTQPLPILS
jgi:menaquinol-cytochrome c reductase iron-sulfur subunit